MEQIEPSEGVHELHERFFDGIRTMLYWIEGTDKTFITVEDTKRGESFSFDVPSPDKAMRAFLHPYAYRPEKTDGR